MKERRLSKPERMRIMSSAAFLELASDLTMCCAAAITSWPSGGAAAMVAVGSDASCEGWGETKPGRKEGGTGRGGDAKWSRLGCAAELGRFESVAGWFRVFFFK
jgi:hypothetical protein